MDVRVLTDANKSLNIYINYVLYIFYSTEVCPLALSSPVKSNLISSTTFEGLDQGKVIKLVSID